MEADFVVVGGGSAGCVLAARLSEDRDADVILLEAGGRDRHPFYHVPAGFAKMTKGMGSWGWETVPQRHLGGRRLRYTQGRVIGGGSSVNAQIYTRGHPADYDGWATDHGCAGWGWEAMLPMFRRAEGNARLSDAFHATDGPLGVDDPRGALPVCHAFLDAAEGWGMPRTPDFNGQDQAGCGFYQLTQRGGRRASAARAYLAPARRRPNLSVRTGAQVRRVVFEGRRAVGVETAAGTLRARRGVIVACGAIGSPRLLMLSGVGPADHLRAVGVPVVHDAAEVGANLQDHLDLCAIAALTGPHSYDGWDRWDRAAWAGLRWLATRRGPASASLFETGAFWTTGDAGRPDLQFHLGQGSGIEAGIDAVAHGITLNSAFLRPRSRGTVRLASADPAAAPLIDPNYWEAPEDRAASLRGLEIAREVLARPELSRFVAREALPGAGVSGADLLDYAKRIAKTDHHPAGTCRMGPDAGAVVDLSLRVNGVEGLRICDASVMPALVSSNTNAPTIAIAEKGAEILRGNR